MAKVVGVGGIFFKSQDPDKLGSWYKQWLGVPVEPPHGANFNPASMPNGSYTVWAPFKSSTSYFDPSRKEFMFNLVVDGPNESRGFGEVEQRNPFRCRIIHPI